MITKLNSLYQIFAQENLEYINDLYREIDLMESLKKRFLNDEEIKQYAEYFIRVNLVEIENLKDEILYDRKTIKEFSSR